MSAPTRFSFLDEGEALRRLGVDRDTLLTLVREKRIRAYPGVGKGNFYRLRDIDALNAEFHAEAASPAAAESGEGEAPTTTGRKVFDPAYKVHVRLQADLKWYDLEDEDLKAWVRELHEDGYPRQRANITAVMSKLQRLIDLMDEAAAGWQTLKSGLPAQSTASTTTMSPAASPARGTSDTMGESGATQTTPRRKTLQMFSGAQTLPPAHATPPTTPPTTPHTAPPAPAEIVAPRDTPTSDTPTSDTQPTTTTATPPTTKTRGRNLPMAMLPQRPPTPQNERADESEQSDPPKQRD